MEQDKIRARAQAWPIWRKTTAGLTMCHPKYSALDRTSAI